MLAAGFAGFATVPLRATAGQCEALALTCIDYRLVDAAVRFFARRHLTGDYDQLSLAGASLAAVSPKFPSSNRAFWDHVEIAKTLHHVGKLVVLDHRDCGAYRVAFGSKFASGGAPETAQHEAVMRALKTELKKRHPDLVPEFYLMALDGSAERLL